tara:strand:- start:268 stop:429 length:162 start_codon:yes stop_codon:yes gene_type:complete
VRKFFFDCDECNEIKEVFRANVTAIAEKIPKPPQGRMFVLIYKVDPLGRPVAV